MAEGLQRKGNPEASFCSVALYDAGPLGIGTHAAGGTAILFPAPSGIEANRNPGPEITYTPGTGRFVLNTPGVYRISALALSLLTAPVGGDTALLTLRIIQDPATTAVVLNNAAWAGALGASEARTETLYVSKTVEVTAAMSAALRTFEINVACTPAGATVPTQGDVNEIYMASLEIQQTR